MTSIKTITLGRRGLLLAGAASTLCAPAIVRAQARKGRQGVGRPPALGGGQLAGDAVHDEQEAVREGRGRARLRPDRRLARLSLGAADGRGVRLGQSRFRHVGQHADRAPARAEPAHPCSHRRRRPFALRARHAQGFADPQHRGPEGQDGRRAARRRSLQRAVADAAPRARQRRSAGARHQGGQHADAGAGRHDAERHGRGDRHLSGLPQGQCGDRHGGHHELVRLHREPLQGAGRRGRGHPADSA